MDNKNWDNCLQEIKKNISAQAFETWFSSVSIIAMDRDNITLQVPNRFHYEWLETKYGELLSDVLKKSFGRRINVNYSVLINSNEEESSSTGKIKKIDELIPTSFHQPSQLNNRYTFKNFIEGKGNQFAKAAASSVADGPGQTPFNPLLIYSNPGLG